MRRPRWIHNPTLAVASSGSFFETVPDFRKMAGIASDGPTSHAILEQVPGVDHGNILTDFLNERRGRKLLAGSGGCSPGKGFGFFTP